MDPATVVEDVIEFRVLGPLEVRVAGLAIDIGGFRQRRLLSLLLCRAGQVVTTDALAEYVWDDTDRPDNAVEAARTYISRLRRAFTDAGLDAASMLITQPPGYLLTLDRAGLDSDRFERLILQARSRHDGGDAVAALVALDEAIALWRGVPFQEFADRSWIQPEVARLTELHRVAVEQRAAARLDVGAHAEVVGELEKLIADDPLRARPVELLMLALYRSGRQADALRVSGRYRRGVNDVGLEPPASVIELDARIAASDDGLQPPVASADTIRGYRLTERIGEGSFSVVYRSVQPSLGREVAVKQIRAELADRPDFIRRFEAEAQTVAALEHPHIVPLYDYWREPGSAYLVMRWLRGGTLESRLRRQRLDADESVTLATQIGSALTAAHHAGVEHGDVRTANIFVDEIGNNYLGDFGIATDDALTDGRGADVRGLGSVLYESVTGQRARNNGGAPSLAGLRPDLPATVDSVLLRAMIGCGTEAYIDVDHFVDDYLAAIGSGPRPGVSAIPRAEDVTNPYKGLRAFQESDADDFHGRGRLIERLLHQLAEPGAAGRLVAAVGPSGSGKSSLVRAGLVPRLRRDAIAGSDSWFVTAMIPGPRPFDELEAALSRIAAVATVGLAEIMAADARGITRAVNATLPDETSELLVVIDQFEELFTLADHDTRASFLDGLVAAVSDPRSRLRVVITIRADHWHRPLQHGELAHLLETSAVTVTPMAPDELERAITDPARRMSVAFEPGLVSDIIGEVHDQPGALPLMQYLLTELFDARRAGLMELETHRRLGGVAGSLSRRADDVYLQSTPSDQDATRRLFLRLIAPGEGSDDTRRRVPVAELATVPDDVIDAYGAARLLTFDHDADSREPTVEVAHEALIREWPRLRAWIDDDRESIRTLRQLTAAATEWERADRADTDLYRGARLEAAEALAHERPGELTPVEQDFLGASIRCRDEDAGRERRRVRRLRLLLTATSIVAVVALVAGVIAIVQQRRADDNAEQASAARDEAEQAQATAEQSAAAERVARSEAEDAARAEGVARDAAERAAEAEHTARDQATVRQRIAESAALRERAPSLAMLIAAEAYDRAPGPETLGAVLTSIQRTDGYLGHMPLAESSSNDQWIGAVDDDTVVVRSPSTIDVYDLSSRTRVGSTLSQSILPGAAVSGSVGGGRFATVDVVRTLRVMEAGDTEPGPPSSPRGVGGFSIGRVTAVALGDDGSMVVGYGHGGIDVVPADPEDETITIGSHPHAVVAAALDDTGTLAATQDQSGNITLWDIETSRARWSWTPGLEPGQDSAAISDQTIELGLGNDGSTSLTLRPVEGGPRPATAAPQDLRGVVGELRFSSDGSTLYSLLAGLLAFEVESGRLAWRTPTSGSQFQLAELADGSVVVGNTIISGGEVIGFLPGIEANARIAVTPDASTLVAIQSEGISVWSTDGRQLAATGRERAGATLATLSRDGERLAAFGFDADGAATRGTISDLTSPTIIEPPAGADRVQYTADGALMAHTVERMVSFHDPTTMVPLGPPLEPQLWASAELAPAKSLAAIGDAYSAEVRVYDVLTGALVTTLTDPLEQSFFDANTGVDDFASGVGWIDFSADEQLLAASNRENVAVWDTSDWTAAGTVDRLPGDSFTDLAFSPDGRSLALVSELGVVALHDLRTGVTRPLATGVPPVSGVLNVNSIEFSSDGSLLTVAGNGVLIIDVATGRLVGTPFPSAQLVSASIAGDGESFVTGTADHLLVWPLDPDEWLATACHAAGRNMTLDEWEQYGWPGEPYHATCDEWANPDDPM